MQPLWWRRKMNQVVWLLVAIFAVQVVMAVKAYACDPGQYYDPDHQICQGSAPAYPKPGYGPWQNNQFGPWKQDIPRYPFGAGDQ
jgi:hypothetical protein